ncbi:hypothetical protein JCM6882_008222 [Rhodosporidiobolus microsporus]
MVAFNALSASVLLTLTTLVSAQAQTQTPAAPSSLAKVVRRSPSAPSSASAPSITPRALPADYTVWTASGVPHTTKVLDPATEVEITCTGTMAEYNCLMGVSRIYACCNAQGRGQACNVLAGPLGQNCFNTGKTTIKCASTASADRNACCEAAFASMFEGGNAEGEEDCPV